MSTPIKLARFFLTFTASVIPLAQSDDSDGENPTPLSTQLREDALTHFENEELWYDYIEALMIDTMEESNLEENLYDEDSLRPLAILINLTEDEDDGSVFHGEISWRGAACLNPMKMLEAAAWRIDDRMTQYGCEDCNFIVSIKTTNIYKKRVKVLPVSKTNVDSSESE